MKRDWVDVDSDEEGMSVNTKQRIKSPEPQTL